MTDMTTSLENGVCEMFERNLRSQKTLQNMVKYTRFVWAAIEQVVENTVEVIEKSTRNNILINSYFIRELMHTQHSFKAYPGWDEAMIWATFSTLETHTRPRKQIRHGVDSELIATSVGHWGYVAGAGELQ